MLGYMLQPALQPFFFPLAVFRSADDGQTSGGTDQRRADASNGQRPAASHSSRAGTAVAARLPAASPADVGPVRAVIRRNRCILTTRGSAGDGFPTTKRAADQWETSSSENHSSVVGSGREQLRWEFGPKEKWINGHDKVFRRGKRYKGSNET